MSHTEVLAELQQSGSSNFLAFPRLVSRDTGALVEAWLVRPRLASSRRFWRLSDQRRIVDGSVELLREGLEVREIVFPAVTDRRGMVECPSAIAAVRKLMEAGYTFGVAHGYVAGVAVLRAGVKTDPSGTLGSISAAVMPAEFLRGVSQGHQAALRQPAPLAPSRPLTLSI